jgi:hypothetical protein
MVPIFKIPVSSFGTTLGVSNEEIRIPVPIGTKVRPK